MAVTVKSLVTLDDIKEHLPIRTAVTEYDATLTKLALVATRQIERACRRHFTKQQFVELHTARHAFHNVLDLQGGSESGMVTRIREQTLILKAKPIDLDETFEIRYDPNADRAFDSQFDVIEEDDYSVDPDTGVVILTVKTYHVRDGIQVTYTAGYAEGVSGTLSENAPDDLKLAAAVQTIWLWKRVLPDNIGGVDKDSQGQGQPFRSHVLAPVVPGLLTPYVRPLTGKL